MYNIFLNFIRNFGTVNEALKIPPGLPWEMPGSLVERGNGCTEPLRDRVERHRKRHRGKETEGNMNMNMKINRKNESKKDMDMDMDMDMEMYSEADTDTLWP
jgi:hypothetical protein